MRMNDVVCPHGNGTKCDGNGENCGGEGPLPVQYEASATTQACPSVKKLANSRIGQFWNWPILALRSELR